MEIFLQEIHRLLWNSEVITALKTAKFLAFPDIAKSLHNLTKYVIIIKNDRIRGSGKGS